MAFEYTPATVSALQATLSAERLRKYLAFAGGDVHQAIKLYEHNSILSEAFYGPLQGIEVACRNAMHMRLSAQFVPEWYIRQEIGLRPPLTDMVSKATQSLIRDGKPVEPGRMVAELNFGFWVGLLGSKYENSLWRLHLRHVFPHRPRGTERKQVQNALNVVRTLRNRVAHHEPILHRNSAADHDLILTVVGWICPHTAAWIDSNSSVHRIAQACLPIQPGTTSGPT